MNVGKAFQSSYSSAITTRVKPRKWMLGISPARQAELAEYREQRNQLLQQYRKENSTLPTRHQAMEKRKQQTSQIRDHQWNEYITRLKEDLQNPHSILNRNQHPCRPLITSHQKSEKDRKQALHNVSYALSKHQIAKRKYLTVLQANLDRAGAIITKSNLDAKIQAALTRPTNFNLTIDQMVERKLQFKTKIKTITVPVDRNLCFCKPLDPNNNH